MEPVADDLLFIPPVAGTGVLEDVSSADGEEPGTRDLELLGFVVDIDPADGTTIPSAS